MIVSYEIAISSENENEVYIIFKYPLPAFLTRVIIICSHTLEREFRFWTSKSKDLLFFCGNLFS
jgi:hypothetical protein